MITIWYTELVIEDYNGVMQSLIAWGIFRTELVFPKITFKLYLFIIEVFIFSVSIILMCTVRPKKLGRTELTADKCAKMILRSKWYLFVWDCFNGAY